MRVPWYNEYGVRSVPRMFLLDREGKVISVNVRDSDLDKLVAAEIEREDGLMCLSLLEIALKVRT